MPAVNIGLMFYNHKARGLLEAFLAEQLAHPSRGQSSIVRAIWGTGEYPLILPPNWLVCGIHEDIEKPITLHVGHKNILKLWQDKFSNDAR